MRASLVGYAPVRLGTEGDVPAGDIVRCVLGLHGIPECYAPLFSVEAREPLLVLELDDPVPREACAGSELLLMPRHATELEESMPLQLKYCVVCYCFRQHRVNAWNYTEHVLLQLAIMLRVVFGSAVGAVGQALAARPPYAPPPGLAVLGDAVSALQQRLEPQALLPERQQGIYGRVRRHMESMELIYFDDFRRLSFDGKLHALHACFLRSAYRGLYFYPVLDARIDWTGLAGLARDGLVLADAELGQAYLYLPFGAFEAAPAAGAEVMLRVRGLLRRDEPSCSSELGSTTEEGGPVGQIARLTAGMGLPVYPRIRAGRGPAALPALLRAQLTRTRRVEEFEERVALVGAAGAEPQAGRGAFWLRFANAGQRANFLAVCARYAAAPAADAGRFLRVQSLSQSELFQNVYLNCCQQLCCAPVEPLMERLDLINDLMYFRGKKVNFTEVAVENRPLTHLDVRALARALVQAVNYSPERGTVPLQVGDTCVHVLAGDGTPYSPVVPVRQDIAQNVFLERIVLADNGFDTVRYVHELAELLRQRPVRASLRRLEVRGNLLKQQGALALGGQLKAVAGLEVLSLNGTGISAAALSNLLYLLDYGRVFLRQLHVAGVRLQTRNQIRQLAAYVANCVLARSEPLEVLDITDVLCSYGRCQLFCSLVQQLAQRPMVVDTLVVRNAEIQAVQELAKVCRLAEV